MEARRSGRTNLRLQPADRPQAPKPVGSEDSARREAVVVGTRLGRRDALTRRLLAVADVIGLALALVAASLIAGIPAVREGPFALLAASLPLVPAWVLLFKLYGLYDRDIKRISHATLDDLPWLFHALLVGGLLMWGYFKLVADYQLSFPEGLTFGLAAIVFVSLLRLLVRRDVLRVLGPERVMIAGTGAMMTPLLRKISKHPEYGLDPIGLITPTGSEPGARLGIPVLGSPRTFHDVAAAYAAERVVICREDFSEEQVLEMIQACRGLSLKVSLLPDVLEAFGPSVEIDQVEGVTVLGVNPPVLSRTSRMIKRSFDFIVATLLLLVFLPLMALIAVAIKRGSPGPVLFRQERIGRDDRRFQLLKFRTMVEDAEQRREELAAESQDPNWLHLEDDPRVTRVGRLLRHSSLDELPQLWNVVKGEMSLVGPRPLIEEEDRRVDGWMRGRLDLQPGITGLWQVLGRTSIPFDEMVKLDYLYVTNWSLWLDVRLLIRTLPVVLSGRGAN